MDGGAFPPEPVAAGPGRAEFSRSRMARLVPTACGAATIALGLLVVVGWHTRTDRILRILPGYRPMTYLTAICFVLCGLALLLRNSKRRGLSTLPLLPMAIIAVVELVNYAGFDLAGLNLPLLRRFAQSDLAMYRMAPSTATAFLLTALALFLSAMRRFSRRPAVGGLAGALTLGVSLVVLMGYVAGTSGYQWGPLAGMAVHTALGLALLGAAVLVIARADEIGVGSHRPPWVLLVGGIAVTLSLWWALLAQDRSFIERTVQVEADSLATELSSEVRSRAQDLFRMSKSWEGRGLIPRSEWESDGRWVHDQNPGSQVLEWADSSLHVRWVVPLQGNEDEMGLDLRGDSLRREALDRALTTGRVAMTRPIRLARGDSGFRIFSPIASGPASGSLLVSTIRLGALCESLFGTENEQGVPIALLDGTREIYRMGAPSPAAASYSREAATDPDTVPVRVRVWPSRDLLDSRSRIATVALVVGLLITGLLGLSVRLGRTARDRAYDAEALNISLNAEMVERGKAEASVAERIRLADFAAEVGAALTRSATLASALTDCADAMVRVLGASLASIWTLNERTNELELAGSAGFGSERPDLRDRVGLGEHRLGRIARDQKPMLVSLLDVDAFEDDKTWARDRGMVSFAGYPLMVGRRTVGVAAIFADRAMTVASLHALSSVADAIALGIDRAQASTALVANEARTRAVIDNMVGGLITTDNHARIETVNPAAEKMFGYAAAELIGANLGVLVSFPEGKDPREYLREAMHKALGKVTEWPARRKDGSVFPMELALSPFETADGSHFSGSVRDVSERTEIDRMKKEFVSTVSHELRTPLTSIRGSLGLLAGGVVGDLPDEAREIVAVAERNVVRLVNLINDILDLERLDTGRLEMRFEMVEVAQILARSLDAVRSFADAQAIRLESVSTTTVLFADADRIVQVLVNLLSNAIKFSPSGSTVSLRVVDTPTETEIRVADHGRGVPEGHLEAIFERFRQVESSDAREKGGSGLGLAICKAIVEQHGGTIGVESEAGKGSAFWIRLPGRIPRFAPAGRSSLPAAARPNVLLVEDDPTLLSVLSRQLTAAGMDVRGASSGRSALSLLAERTPDLLVLDLKLPDGDGFFVVEELRKRSTDLLALLVYTERDLNARERDRLRLGPTRFLTKSRSTDQEFLGAVLDMLSESHAKER